MKVKLFWVSAPVGNDDTGARAFETEINTWLGANPRIKIVNVKQSSNGGGSLGSPLWLVSVWYEESAAESGAAPDTGRR